MRKFKPQGTASKINEAIGDKLKPKDKRLSFGILQKGADISDIVELAKRSHEESHFAYITFAPEKVRAAAERVLADNMRQAIMMCWSHNRPVGFAHCTIGEFYLGSGTLVTSIRNINVLPEERCKLGGGKVALGLMKGVESWSRERNSKEILIHVTSDIDLGRTDRFVKRFGYRSIGGNYAKVLY